MNTNLDTSVNDQSFDLLNKGYNSIFKIGQMSIGIVVPIESYSSSPVPTMDNHIERVQLVEQLGFSSIWLRDVPFNVPSFGDAGQMYDPFVYLGLLTAQTNTIALGVASIVLPLRHPADVAKAAASVDVLSDGRLILGVASGDRPQEYPAMNINYDNRGERFRESFEYIRMMQTDNPSLNNVYGSFTGDIDMLPKPTARLPMLITGGSQQSPEWIAQNGDGWMLYPREPKIQERIIKGWNERVEKSERLPQPIMQPLYFDLSESSNAQPQPLHLGFRSGTEYLIKYLKELETIGVNHVALNLRFNQSDTESTLERLADELIPEFSQ
ncbi:MAG: LLM class oxidoreductase [Gammaproteobacteria bacterium]